MPRKSLEVQATPAILAWARESSGWTVEEIASKLRTNPNIVQKWESGESYPTLRALEKLAGYYKRPLAAFFLPEPPQEPPPPSDFRMLPGERHTFSKSTYLAIRKARRLQAIAAELMEGLGLEVRAKIRTASPTDNAEEIARVERKHLDIDIDQQTGWKNFSEAFEAWRNVVENMNILVFRFSMPLEDARGFSLNKKGPAAIVVNSSDAARARIFTLFHEYAHLLLQQPGICIPEDILTTGNYSGDIERWCNRFAGELLVPEEVMRSDEDFRTFVYSGDSPHELLEKLSSRFKVSTRVILVRMLTSGLISRKRYQEEIAYLESQEEERGRQEEKPRRFAISQARKCFQERGRLFTSLVLEGKERELVTYSDVTDYLSLRLRHLDKLQPLIWV